MTTLNVLGKKPSNVWMENGVTRYHSVKVKDVLDRNYNSCSMINKPQRQSNRKILREWKMLFIIVL